MKEKYTYKLYKEGDRLDFYGEVWVAGEKKKTVTVSNLIYRDWFAIRFLDAAADSCTHPQMFEELIAEYDAE